MLTRALLAVSFGLASTVAKPCTVFDVNWGLYVFGLTQDLSLGPSSNWGATPLQTTTLTTTGRPPFDGPNTQCFLSQYQNAAYVLNADTTQPSNLHIFNFGTQSWTTQQISAGGTNPNTFTAILDRNTNVFFALSDSQLYSLDMGTLAQADGTTRPWGFVEVPPWSQNGAYPTPVMALADNHIHFLDVGTPGQAAIFVIHFSYSQPEYQIYPPIENGGFAFPSSSGKTTSIFKGDEAVQTKFVYIPDDGSNTFIVDVIANNTQTLGGPAHRAVGSLSASRREIVQMTPDGDVWWLPFNPDDVGPNYGAQWSKLVLPVGLPSDNPPTSSGNGNGNGNGNTNGTSNTSTRTGTFTAASTNSPSNSNFDAEGSANGRHSFNGFFVGATVTILGLVGLFSSL